MTVVSSRRTLAVVGAHVGDCEVMAGGIAAKAVAEGYSVYFIHMTYGEKGHPKLSPEEYLRQKKLEAEIFAKRLGINVGFMGLRDGEVENNVDVRIRLAELIRSIRPSLIITHWKGSIHRDHIATYQIVMDSVFYAANRWFKVRGEPCWARVFFAENWEDHDGYQPEIYVDISDVYDKWISALRECAFARGETGFNYIDYYSSLARLRGLESGTTYAQTLMRPWYLRRIRIKRMDALI